MSCMAALVAFSHRIPPVQNIAIFLFFADASSILLLLLLLTLPSFSSTVSLPLPSTRFCFIQSGNSINDCVCGLTAFRNVPMSISYSFRVSITSVSGSSNSLFQSRGLTYSPFRSDGRQGTQDEPEQIFVVLSLPFLSSWLRVLQGAVVSSAPPSLFLLFCLSPCQCIVTISDLILILRRANTGRSAGDIRILKEPSNFACNRDSNSSPSSFLSTMLSWVTVASESSSTTAVVAVLIAVAAAALCRKG
mmetsp:Transcript_1045/g.2201  ORF Transcript_1045/g.2201 Transcript_1045/m.2201 type:complete len:248 (-) Transcript_1045:527-1270(-)